MQNVYFLLAYIGENSLLTFGMCERQFDRLFELLNLRIEAANIGERFLKNKKRTSYKTYAI